VNFGANQVLDKLRLQRFGIAHLPDADGYGILSGDLCSTVTPFAKDDFETVLGERPHQQR